MGLILCHENQALRPYYIDDLGIHIYTIEQLCYCIYEYPLIAADGFVTRSLLDFITSELHLYLRTEGIREDDLLISILGICDYYTSAEVDRFRTRMQELRKLKRAAFLKEKGDFLFGLHKYGKAIKTYRDALKEFNDAASEDEFYAALYNNIGSCYANLFEYEKAFAAYTEALKFRKDLTIMKHIYFLSFMDPVIENKTMYQESLNGRTDTHWDREFEQKKEDAGNCAAVIGLREELSRDSVRRAKTMEHRLTEWKHKYREMV